MTTARTQTKWVLTASALDKLLRALGPDRDEAGRRYETIHAGLVRFFRGRGCPGAESLADVTIDRVCRRIDEGQAFDGQATYFHAVARNVLREQHRRERRFQTIRAFFGTAAVDMAWGALLHGDDDEKMSCLRACLGTLTDSERDLIRQYYGPGVREGGRDLAERAALAGRIGITHANLRQRAYRIRRRLEECFRHRRTREPRA